MKKIYKNRKNLKNKNYYWFEKRCLKNLKTKLKNFKTYFHLKK